jgi:hypothetical protein
LLRSFPVPTPIEFFRSALAEERIIQRAWNREENGKHYVCLAAAWGEPGTIKSVSDCPVKLFPRWVFELMPTLDDGVAAADLPWLFQGFADRAEKMAAFTSEQWEQARTDFLVAVIDVAIENARPSQPSPTPAYWVEVIAACEGVKQALKGNGDLEAAAWAWAEAWAAWAWAAVPAAVRAAAYKDIAGRFFACVDAITE